MAVLTADCQALNDTWSTIYRGSFVIPSTFAGTSHSQPEHTGISCSPIGVSPDGKITGRVFV